MSNLSANVFTPTLLVLSGNMQKPYLCRLSHQNHVSVIHLISLYLPQQDTERNSRVMTGYVCISSVREPISIIVNIYLSNRGQSYEVSEYCNHT